MISIADILRPEDILLDLNVSGATALFDEVGQLMQRRHGLPRVRVAEALVQREAFGSTALGQGVAIPHGRLAGLRETHAAYVRPRRPMPFAAPSFMCVTVRSTSSMRSRFQVSRIERKCSVCSLFMYSSPLRAT